MAIPLSAYPHDSSFNEETYNNMTGAAHKPSYSCCAFARYVYKQHNGKETGTSIGTSTDIANIPKGSILKTSYAGGPHWLIVGEHKSGGKSFMVYDANFVTSPRSSSPYAVKYREVTYEDFRKKYTLQSGCLKP